MKQLLVIAIALTAINAQASRARVNALGNSAHLVDTNTVYSNPADVFALPSDYVVLETGAVQNTLAATTQNANPEGMIVRTMGDAKLGLSLGHQTANASSWGLRSAAATAALEVNQQNPVELTYGMKTGDIGWAGTLVYSNYNNKAATAGTVEKENTLGVRLGARAGNWDAAARIGLNSNVQLAAGGNELKGNTAIAVNGGYWFDNMYVFGGYSTAGIKEEGGGTTAVDFKTDSINVGVLSSMKKDGSELFYSAQVASTTSKEDVADSKTTTLTLPLTIGLELDAASWLTFRGALTQNVLLDNSKTETAGTTTAELAPGANDTTVALGAGLKFNKLTIDGTLQTATTQTVNTSALMAQVGATYWF